MNHRFLASMSALGVVTVLVLLTPILIAGQAPLSAAKTRTPPHTPDGKPDLQGIWTNATVTPLERPRDLAGKEFLTETEAAEFEKLAVYDANGDRRDGTADRLEAARRRGGAFDGPENRSLAERCLLMPQAGPPMLPANYNSNYQIVQAPGSVVIL